MIIQIKIPQKPITPPTRTVTLRYYVFHASVESGPLMGAFTSLDDATLFVDIRSKSFGVKSSSYIIVDEQD